MVDLAWRPLVPRPAAQAGGMAVRCGMPRPSGPALRYATPAQATAEPRIVEPYAVLVNVAKARAARAVRFTVAGLLEQGLRLQLPLHLEADSGDTGWIHPLFAEYTGWPGRDVAGSPDLFLDPAALDGMSRLRERLLQHCAVRPAASSDALLAEWLDPGRPEVVAVYANPLVVAARPGFPHGPGLPFQAVSLQRFMGLSTPSLFRTAPVSAPQPDAGPDLPHHAVPADSPLLVPLPHDAWFYGRLPQLACMADSPLMARLAFNLLLPDAAGGAPSKSAATAYAAAAAAHYDLVKRLRRITVAP